MALPSAKIRPEPQHSALKLKPSRACVLPPPVVAASDMWVQASELVAQSSCPPAQGSETGPRCLPRYRMPLAFCTARRIARRRYRPNHPASSTSVSITSEGSLTPKSLGMRNGRRNRQSASTTHSITATNIQIGHSGGVNAQATPTPISTVMKCEGWNSQYDQRSDSERVSRVTVPEFISWRRSDMRRSYESEI